LTELYHVFYSLVLVSVML